MKAYVLVVCLAVALSTAGSAAVIQQDNSDYGNFGPDCTTVVGNNCDLTQAPGVIGQSFPFSGNSNDAVTFQVFDFQITTNPSNFTLTLSGTLPFAADQTFGNQRVFGFGMFCLWLFLMYKAYNKEKFVIPIIGPLAEKQAGA